MPIVGAFNFPHGSIALEPEKHDLSSLPAVRPTTREECVGLYNAMQNAAAALVATGPDLIVMTTPHALKVMNNYAFFGNNAKGTAEWDNVYSDYTANIDIDVDTTDYLLQNLLKLGNPVDLLRIGLYSGEFLPLRWAEVIPWWLINEEAKKVGFKLPKAVILSLPLKFMYASKGYKNKKSSISEALKIGSDLFDLFENNSNYANKRIVIVTSVDLSHNHSKASSSPFPFLESASKFDEHQLNWAKLDIDSKTIEESDEYLLVKAAELADINDCCGFMGLVILQGLMKRGVTSSDAKYKANFIDYFAPTYYGMMSSYFLKA